MFIFLDKVLVCLRQPTVVVKDVQLLRAKRSHCNDQEPEYDIVLRILLLCRCVQDDLRPFALGVQWTVMRLLGEFRVIPAYISNIWR